MATAARGDVPIVPWPGGGVWRIRATMFHAAQLVLCLCLVSSCTPKAPVAHPERGPSLRTGDLVFLDLDCPECDAIAAVTREQFSVAGPSLSHVGLVSLDAHKRPWILEAWPDLGVTRTTAAAFLSRVKGAENEPRGYYVLRPQGQARVLAAAASRHIAAVMNAPYDDLFLPKNGRYYCSELIAEAFSKASGGKPIFRLVPMYFGREGSPERAVWQAYYQKRNKEIPDGQPGVSPLGIYLTARKWDHDN